MKTSYLLRLVVPSLALFAGACLQAAGTGGDGGSASGTGTSSSSGSSSSSSSSGSTATTSSGSSGSTASSSSSSGSSTTSTALTIGSPCSVGFTGGGTDPCAAVGLVCQISGIGTSGETGTCQLPATGDTCNTTVGCVTGDNCVNGKCAQTCTTTTDCSALTSACDTASGTCTTNECDADGGYYGPCNATGVDDGVCLPVTEGGKTVGVCLATGDAGAYSTCSDSRTGTGQLCSAGNYCVALPAAAGGASACMPLCSTTGTGAGGGTPDAGALDGGAPTDAGTAAYTCSSGAMCENPGALTGAGGGGGGHGGGGGTGGLGVCVTSCANGATCPGSLTCLSLPTIGSYCVP